jgi:hypothetical protein
VEISPDDRRRARAVAAVVSRLAADAGRALPDDLSIWRLAGGSPGTFGELPADGADLARALESATSDERRRRVGLHVTPRWLADELVALGLDDHGRYRAGGTGAADGRTAHVPAVCDPSCGGGAFLLASARALAARGVPRVEIARQALWGADIDPVGLAAAEAALAVWAGEVPPRGRLVVADPLRSGASVWPEAPAAGFDLVVGNPPFQSQLDRATARAAADREALRARFGRAVRAYTDTAWLFLLLACDLAAPGGRVVLVQPQSLVAARDGAAVRHALADRARLRSLWVEQQPVFDAAVRVCAPVLDVVESPRPTVEGHTGSWRARAAGEPAKALGAPGGEASARPSVEDAWRDGLSEALGLPRVRLRAAGRLGDRARAVAGFRDEYYGLAHVVREARAHEVAELAGAPAARHPVEAVRDRVEPAAGVAALVTAGAIGWSGTTWGDVPVRYARRRWAAPVVDLAAVAQRGDRTTRRWIERTAGAKVLVASQTSVVEAVVDEAGRWVPSIPVIALVPHDPDDVWLVAAALLAPAATAWLARRAPGTALARSAIKVAAPDLVALPLPGDTGAWREAAAVLRSLSEVSTPGPPGPRATRSRVGEDDGTAALDHFVDLTSAAYDLGDRAAAVARWWRGRLPAADSYRARAGRRTGHRAGETG